MADKPKVKKKLKNCDCGELLDPEEAEFWGECPKCRIKPAIKTRQVHDDDRNQAAADRRYHGGDFGSAEW